MSKKKYDHPFFCMKRNCQKTAWDTPEYLTKEDWDFLKKIVDVLEQAKDNNDCSGFHKLLFGRGHNDDLTKAFFYRVMGWAEGYSYCHENGRYLELTAFPIIRNRHFLKFKEALKNHEEGK